MVVLSPVLNFDFPGTRRARRQVDTLTMRCRVLVSELQSAEQEEVQAAAAHFNAQQHLQELTAAAQAAKHR